LGRKKKEEPERRSWKKVNRSERAKREESREKKGSRTERGEVDHLRFWELSRVFFFPSFRATSLCG
jgi:hypothetical protein